MSTSRNRGKNFTYIGNIKGRKDNKNGNRNVSNIINNVSNINNNMNNVSNMSNNNLVDIDINCKDSNKNIKNLLFKE